MTWLEQEAGWEDRQADRHIPMDVAIPVAAPQTPPGLRLPHPCRAVLKAEEKQVLSVFSERFTPSSVLYKENPCVCGENMPVGKMSVRVNVSP